MIINIGQRTDIPAFYSEWFYNRIKEGYVLVRNPYFPQKIAKYKLQPDIVDCLCFCTKNPIPMLKRIDEINHFRQLWYITITPYEKDIEPYVPHFNKIIKAFIFLSKKVGKKSMFWRYDPIFLNEKYTKIYHYQAFRYLCSHLSSYTNKCIISFIDLYKNTQLNFPNGKEVDLQTQFEMIKTFKTIADEYGIVLYSCCENKAFEDYGICVDGCMTKDLIEKSLDISLNVKNKNVRSGCSCLLGNDIGVYNSCLHGCLYCYANDNKNLVMHNYKKHDPKSPLLIGHVYSHDIIYDAKQKSYLNNQLSFDI